MRHVTCTCYREDSATWLRGIPHQGWFAFNQSITISYIFVSYPSPSYCSLSLLRPFLFVCLSLPLYFPRSSVVLRSFSFSIFIFVFFFPFFTFSIPLLLFFFLFRYSFLSSSSLFSLFLYLFTHSCPYSMKLYCNSMVSSYCSFLVIAFWLSFFLPILCLLLLLIPLPLLFYPSYLEYLPPLSLSYLPFSISSSIQRSSLSLRSTIPWFLYSFRFFFLHTFVWVIHVYLLFPLPFIYSYLSFSSLSLPFLKVRRLFIFAYYCKTWLGCYLQ